jgi:ATP-dependent DNA helicase RecG
MKTAAELLEELDTLDEHVSIDAKTGSDVGPSLLQTICAFSNEPELGGGYLLLGVAPDEATLWPTYRVVGVDDPDKLQNDIASQCATVFNSPIRPRMVTERLQGKTVITLFVPEAGSHEKPIRFKNQPLPQGAYRRIGSTDQRCTEDDLVVFYQDRKGETHDQQIVADAEVSDLDPEAIELYRRLRKEVDPEAEEVRWDDVELLQALGAVRRDSGVLKPTVAGVLLFGTSRALRQHVPMMRIDYIRVPGVQWVRDPDRRFDTIEIRSPLIRAVQRARAAILDDLPKAFSLPAGETQGKELPLLPDRVIREVVANAVIHRSYRVHGSIQIIRYANRLEIRNPGYSLKAEERLGEPGSETRNPKIAAVFHDVRLAETKGSGIRVMRDLMAEGNLSPPYFQSDRINNSFLVILLFHHFLSPEDLEWLNHFKDDGLSECETKALVSAREVGAIDNSSYRNLNRGVDTLSASRHLRKLCDHGLLQKKGQGSGTFYVPTEKILTPWYAIQARGSVKPSELSRKPSEFPGKPSESNSEATNSTPEQSEGTVELSQVPEPIRLEIERIGRKADKRDLQDVVRRLCEWRDLSLPMLASLLGRAEVYLRQKVVSPMVREGRLRFTIPEEPNHPRQKYRAMPPDGAA